jgi:hypothetical protein
MRPRSVGASAAALEPEIVEVVAPVALEAQTRGEIDIQIATARRFPRSIEAFQKKATSMATLDEETAASCFYVLPKRKGQDKPIEGPSARLAEIVASAWGHMRIEARIVDMDDRFVTARGVAWDVESNVARAIEVRRRITDREGRRYSDDMVMVTSNAACAIASRNAVFQVIPNTYVRQLFQQCKQVAVGSAQTLVAKRAEMIAYFQKMSVTPARVFAALEVKGLEDITLEHMATLRGLATAIKEGDTSIDEAFPELDAKKAATFDPLATIVAELECSEAVAVAILAGFTAAGTIQAQRMVLLKKHKGRADVLLQMLRDMSGQALPVSTDVTVSAPQASESTTEQVSPNLAATTSAIQLTSPSATGRPSGRFSI